MIRESLTGTSSLLTYDIRLASIPIAAVVDTTFAIPTSSTITSNRTGLRDQIHFRWVLLWAEVRINLPLCLTFFVEAKCRENSGVAGDMWLGGRTYVLEKAHQPHTTLSAPHMLYVISSSPTL